jgi:hypothetical protein
MERIKMVLSMGALALWCGAVSAGAAHAASCHQAVADSTYSCTAAPGSGTSQIEAVFNSTGETATILGTTVRCFCSSAGSGIASLKIETGLGIVCVKTFGGDNALALSARVAGKKLIQGTIAALHEVGAPETALLTCDRTN